MAFARINYHSRSLQKASSVSVVFPDDPAIPRPWSVFCLLHGLSDDDTIPLNAVHRSQARARFEGSSEPPCFRGRTCSM